MKNKKDIIEYIEEHRGEIGKGSIRQKHCMLYHCGMTGYDIDSPTNSVSARKLAKKLIGLLTTSLKKLGCPTNQDGAWVIVAVNDDAVGALTKCLGLNEDCQPADRLLKVLKA